MELIEILGFASAILIGFTLGLIGGGGSILTVPALKYLLGFSAVFSTAYSLFIVGISALIGSIAYMRKGLVSYKTAFVFAIPSLIAVAATRKFIIPAIPEEIFSIGSMMVTRDLLIMLLFAVIMLGASFSMIRSGRKSKLANSDEEETIHFNYPMIMIEGAVVGLLTGLVGAGGGFLIIPALVLLAKLPMKLAIGTSLLIISAKSLIGFFLGDVTELTIDWQFLMYFSALAIIGIFIGSYASKFIEGSKLKGGFGWFVLIMAIYILIKELVIDKQLV